MIHVLPDDVEHCQVTAEASLAPESRKETHGTVQIPHLASLGVSASLRFSSLIHKMGILGPSPPAA